MSLHRDFDMASDELWPRDEEHRYRIYARIGNSMTVLAATHHPEGIGAALVQLHEDAKEIDRRLCDEGRIGVLDVLGGKNGKGDWIVPLWDRS